MNVAPSGLSLPILTQRLIIRDFSPTDIPTVIDIVKHPNFSDYRQFRPNHMEADVAAYIQKALDAQKLDASKCRELFRLAICLQDNSVIGCCVFDGWNKFSDDQVGYFIHPAHQGYGYAAEAMQALLQLYWAQYPDRPVYATVHPSNKASQKILEKLNFSKCGGKNIEIDGQTQPRLIYSARA